MPPMAQTNFEPRTFLNITPIQSSKITTVDLGELHEGGSEGPEVPHFLARSPILARHSHGIVGGRHKSLPPITLTTPMTMTTTKNIAPRMSNVAVEENAQEDEETSLDTSEQDATFSEDGEMPLRNSQVSKTKKRLQCLTSDE